MPNVVPVLLIALNPLRNIRTPLTVSASVTALGVMVGLLTLIWALRIFRNVKEQGKLA